MARHRTWITREEIADIYEEMAKRATVEIFAQSKPAPTNVEIRESVRKSRSRDLSAKTLRYADNLYRKGVNAR